MNFLHVAHPKDVAFSVFNLEIYWYGIVAVIAIIVGLVIILQIAKKKQVSSDHIYNLLFWLIIFGLIGGRLVHVIGDWGYYKNNLSQIIKVWQGGLAFFGVLMASIGVVFVYGKVKKISFWLLSDLIVVALPLMQAMARWGNYFNQELYGQPTDLPWGIPIDIDKRLVGLEGQVYYHPVFLYESLLMILIFVLLLYLFQSNKLKTGQLTLFYFLLFSVERFFLDYLRIDMLQVGPLLATQWLSIILFIAAVVIWLKLFWAKTNENRELK